MTEVDYCETVKRFHNSFPEAFGENKVDIIDTIDNDYWNNPIVWCCLIDDDVYMQCVQECDDAEHDGYQWRYWYCYRPLVVGPVQKTE